MQREILKTIIEELKKDFCHLKIWLVFENYNCEEEILDKEGLLSLENLTCIWKLQLQREILDREGLPSLENLTGIWKL